MADYDIEDLEVETFDIAGEDVDTDYDEDEDDDEQYDEAGEFGEFDAEAAEERWKDKDFEELVAELAALVASGKKYLFFSKKKRVVNGFEIDMLSQYIQNKFPEEFAKAKDVLTRKDAILSEAQARHDATIADADSYKSKVHADAQAYYDDAVAKAEREAAAIIARAQAQAHDMVQEHSITRMAREESERLKAETERVCQERIAQTTQQAEELKKRARDYAASIVQGAYNFVRNGLSGYQSVAASSLDSINKVHQQFQSDYAVQVRNLGIENNNQ